MKSENESFLDIIKNILSWIVKWWSDHWNVGEKIGNEDTDTETTKESEKPKTPEITPEPETPETNKNDELNNVTEDKSIGRIESLDDRGLNMIANMERDLSLIKYDKESNKILSIPTTSTDVGYGHDYTQNPMEHVPESLNAEEALTLLRTDTANFALPIVGINDDFTQDQFNALVSLRYNVGTLGSIDGLLGYLDSKTYERETMQKYIISHYDAIIFKNPDKEKYRNGWYDRTDKFLNIFFEGEYGDMPIDAVNCIVIKTN